MSPLSKVAPLTGNRARLVLDDAVMDEDGLCRAVSLFFQAPEYRPPSLPKVAMELLELSRQPHAGYSDMASLLEQDTILAAEVLKTASASAYCGTAKPPTTLGAAFVKLGVHNIRSLILHSALNVRVFKAGCYTDHLAQLQRHSTATAYIARTIGRRLGIGREQAFMCALLHDIGIAGILLALGDVPPGFKTPSLDRLWPVIDRVHQEASWTISRLWGLSNEISEVLLCHHHPRTLDGFHPLAGVVCLSEHLAQELGYVLDVHPKGIVDHSPQCTIDFVLKELGIDRSELEELREESADALDMMEL